MTNDEVLTALRMHADGECNKKCPMWEKRGGCLSSVLYAAANLIEFQQQGLEALTKMDEGLKERGNSLREFLRRGDEIVQEHRDPTGPPGARGIVGDEGNGPGPVGETGPIGPRYEGGGSIAGDEGCGRDDPGETGPMAAVCCEGDIFICPTCSSPRVFYNAEKDAYICPSCGWQDKEG